jgi:RNA recognition motif-containing protein
MRKNIYVGGLPYAVNDDQLEEVFSEFGPVQSARVITDRMTGQSRGFGFVEMDEEDATKAISALNGSQLGGRTLTVNEARPRERRSGGGGYGGGYGSRGRGRW